MASLFTTDISCHLHGRCLIDLSKEEERRKGKQDKSEERRKGERGKMKDNEKGESSKKRNELEHQ